LLALFATFEPIDITDVNLCLQCLLQLERSYKAVPPSALQAFREKIVPLPGFKPAKSMVFAGLFPTSSADFEDLRDAMEKLTLNDASVSVQVVIYSVAVCVCLHGNPNMFLGADLLNSRSTVQMESSVALGMGFRCGFLGVLHMDVFCQRLEQEFGASVIMTSPTVPFQYINLKGGTLCLYVVTRIKPSMPISNVFHS